MTWPDGYHQLHEVLDAHPLVGEVRGDGMLAAV
ncbi:hypothetical protein PSYPI_48243, partial [Pseudomonas syringae pv. pisi str. 1704B]